MIAPATPLADVLERDLTTQVVELATTLGWKRYHTYRSKRSPSGFPDEVLVRDRVVYLELKREHTKPTVDQKEWLRALLAAGAEAYIVRPRHLQALASVLACRGVPWLSRGAVVDVAAGLREQTRREIE